MDLGNQPSFELTILMLIWKEGSSVLTLGFSPERSKSYWSVRPRSRSLWGRSGNRRITSAPDVMMRKSNSASVSASGLSAVVWMTGKSVELCHYFRLSVWI